MVTAATYKKSFLFNTDEKLAYLHDRLLIFAEEHDWHLRAWAVLANHYHFVAQSPEDPKNLTTFLAKLHFDTARFLNNLDNTPQRRVWWQYWDTRITHQYSYLARLNYVNQNPVRHGLVSSATEYPWCSASWFEKENPKSFCNTVRNFKVDKVNVIDDF